MMVEASESAADSGPRSADALPSSRRILDMASGYEPALILEAAVRLGVFDALSPGALSAADVVERIGVSLRGVRALLGALVGLDLLEKRAERYALTPESRAYLVSESPTFQGQMCKHVSRLMLPRWMHLAESVRTGRPTAAVNAEEVGGPFFQQFVEDIFPMSRDAAGALATELNLANADRPVGVLDLAAGSGVWGITLAEATARVTVTAVDWPGVLPVTRRLAERHGVIDRFHFIAGDLLDVDFGASHDIATLGHILHSEGEVRSRRLLKKTFDALAPGGTVAIAEFIADEDRAGPAGALIFAVTMLVNTDEGDTFTFSEMAQWLTHAGFTGIRQFDAPGPAPLVLATRG